MKTFRTRQRRLHRIKYIAAVSQRKTTPQQSAAIPTMLTPFHAASTPTISARIPATGICGAVVIAGKVITANVTYGT